MLQYNLLARETKPRLEMAMMLVLFVGITGIYFFKARDFAYTKTQYDFYLHYLETHRASNIQNSIPALSIPQLHHHFDGLVTLLPVNMQLEKIVLQKNDIWLRGYVLEHQAFYRFWQQIKQHLAIKHVYLLNMEHTKPPVTMDAWKFSIKMSF